jgi:hypothetical protein
MRQFDGDSRQADEMQIIHVERDPGSFNAGELSPINYDLCRSCVNQLRSWLRKIPIAASESHAQPRTGAK